MRNTLTVEITHPKASYVRQLAKEGLFDGCVNGQDLIEKIIPNAKKLGVNNKQQGYIGEVLTEAIRRIVLGLTKVYHSDHIPNDLVKKFAICTDGNENGVDYVELGKDGEWWAVQVKLYDRDNLSKKKIDSALNEAHAFGKRVLIVTSCKTVDARGKIGRPFSSYKREDFEELTEEETKAIIDCIKKGHGKPVSIKDYEYRKHQDDEAVPESVDGLIKNKRHTYIAPTGVGKTAVSVGKVARKIAEIIKAKNPKCSPQKNLIIIPKITDCQQMARNIDLRFPEFNILTVNSGSDVEVEQLQEVERYPDNKIPATTDPKEISEWHEEHKDEDTWDVTTYDSLPLLKGIKFDYAIFDEADLIAGTDAAKQFGLYDDNIKIDYRYFTTATWKPCATTDTKNELAFVSMHDEELFGKKTVLTDHEATKRGLIARVDLRYPVFTDKELNIEDGYVNVDGVSVQPFRMACIYSCIQHFENHPHHRKMAARFNEKKAAESFVSDAANGLGYHTEDFHLAYIHSGLTPNQRAKVLREFEATKKKAVLASCGTIDRCWDCVPLNCYIICDPVHSASIGIQFNGRVTRKDPNMIIDGEEISPIGTMPILQYEAKGETLQEAVHRTRFARLRNTLCSRLDMDGTLYLGAVIYGKERKKVLGFIRGLIDDSPDELERGLGGGDLIGADDIYDALAERILDYFSPRSFSDFMEIAAKLYEKYGNCNTYISPIEDKRNPDPLITDQYGTKLCRYRTLHSHGWLGKDEVEALEKFNIEWKPDDKHFILSVELIGYIIETYGTNSKGHVRWTKAVKDGVMSKEKRASIGSYISQQRKHSQKDDFPEWRLKHMIKNNFPFEEFGVDHRKECLTVIGDYVKKAKKIKADPKTDKRFNKRWRVSCFQIEDHFDKIVISKHEKHKGKSIGAFVTNVVTEKNSDHEESIKALNKMGVYTGNFVEDSFRINLSLWREHRDKVTDNGKKIVFKDDEHYESKRCTWATTQMQADEKGKQPPHRRKQLEENGFFDPLYNTSLLRNQARRILIDKHVADNGCCIISKDADQFMYQVVETVRTQIKRDDKVKTLSKEEIKHYESLPYWKSEAGVKSKKVTETERILFESKANLWVKWHEENPDKEFPPMVLDVEHDYPFKLGNKDGVFKLGKFGNNIRRRLYGTAKEFSQLKEWQIKILDEKLGKKWRQTLEDVNRLRRFKIKKVITPKQTRYDIYLGLDNGKKVSKSCCRMSDAKKALAIYQKAFDKGWDKTFEELRGLAKIDRSCRNK